MQIKISDLEKAINLTLSHIKNKRINSVEIRHDYYWEVLLDDRFNLSRSPQSLGCGQISEDLENIQKLLNGEHDPINYDLVSIASILRYIGEKVGEAEGL